MRAIRRALAPAALAGALLLAPLAPAASAAPAAPAAKSHVSAWLCIAGGGHVVHYPGFRLCIGGLFHGRVII